MLSRLFKKKPKDLINSANIHTMSFSIDSSGNKPFPGGTFDAYSLATLTIGRSDDYLNLLRDSIKIKEGNSSKNIDQTTFNELIEYGNSLKSAPRNQ